MNEYLVALVAVTVTFGAAWPLRHLALRYGILDHPGPRKSQGAPIPYLGGVAVVAGLGAGLVVGHPHFVRVFALMGVICALGLFDDLWHASVPTKLLAEGSVAAAAVGLGYGWQITDSMPLNAVVSVLWIVGLSNAFNLLDNMDGLSSTAAALPLIAFGVIAPSATTPLALALAAALVGFLLINRPPARMYLGDAGSLTIGFGVALVSIAAANTERGLHSVVLLAGPVSLALFDTSLVIVSRLMNGRPIQLGGRDHFSHRLLLLGWSPYTILLATVAASAMSGLITYLASSYPLNMAWLALPLAAAYGVAWLRLLRVDPYSSATEYRPEVLRAQNL